MLHHGRRPCVATCARPRCCAHTFRFPASAIRCTYMTPRSPYGLPYAGQWRLPVLVRAVHAGQRPAAAHPAAVLRCVPRGLLASCFWLPPWPAQVNELQGYPRSVPRRQLAYALPCHVVRACRYGTCSTWRSTGRPCTCQPALAPMSKPMYQERCIVLSLITQDLHTIDQDLHAPTVPARLWLRV